MRVQVGVAFVLLVACLAWAPGAYAQGTPSGERILGRSSIEPAYDDMTGNLIYLLTPLGVPNPVKSNPKSWAPLYLIVYPISAGSAVGPMNCQHEGGDNCPDHGPEIAGAAGRTSLRPAGDPSPEAKRDIRAPRASRLHISTDRSDRRPHPIAWELRHWRRTRHPGGRR